MNIGPLMTMGVVVLICMAIATIPMNKPLRAAISVGSNSRPHRRFATQKYPMRASNSQHGLSPFVQDSIENKAQEYSQEHREIKSFQTVPLASNFNELNTIKKLKAIFAQIEDTTLREIVYLSSDTAQMIKNVGNDMINDSLDSHLKQYLAYSGNIEIVASIQTHLKNFNVAYNHFKNLVIKDVRTNIDETMVYYIKQFGWNLEGLNMVTAKVFSTATALTLKEFDLDYKQYFESDIIRVFVDYTVQSRLLKVYNDQNETIQVYLDKNTLDNNNESIQLLYTEFHRPLQE